MNSGRRALGIVAGAALMLLSACVMPAGQWRASTPAPCSDSAYVILQQQHPDSLSARTWQR